MTEPGAEFNPKEHRLEDILKACKHPIYLKSRKLTQNADGLPDFPDLPDLAEVTALLHQRASIPQHLAKPDNEQPDYWQNYSSNAHTLAIQYAKEAKDLRDQVVKLEYEAGENDSVRDMRNLVKSLSLKQGVVDAQVAKLQDAAEDDQRDSLVTNDTKYTFCAPVKQLEQRMTEKNEARELAWKRDDLPEPLLKDLENKCNQLKEVISELENVADIIPEYKHAIWILSILFLSARDFCTDLLAHVVKFSPDVLDPLVENWICQHERFHIMTDITAREPNFLKCSSTTNDHTAGATAGATAMRVFREAITISVSTYPPPVLDEEDIRDIVKEGFDPSRTTEEVLESLPTKHLLYFDSLEKCRSMDLVGMRKFLHVWNKRWSG
ncbi:hypothetical protein FB567DRAFT_554628 [Paraphoma chrysanthemicola]|uniref:Uncharacterized protein n=1 Tax=Paraphoma chrysanthemicola TaxID=798071 RepID=A0A8K0VSH7_9PLEO|nr:hypothetical protein FB567DRAFT_554628 [Paraphoma chrysanthemicola]